MAMRRRWKFHAPAAALGLLAAGFVFWRLHRECPTAGAAGLDAMRSFDAVVPAAALRRTKSGEEHSKPMKTISGKKRAKNHLAGEKSPYLRQHVYNPVDWHPWGEPAFEKARKENKPVFLSIGYSTCHWCHVMERESFSDERIAGILNEHFVAIKVDREERPDIDKVYMTLATGAGWGGGWPLSIWMTHERKPFYGGTYFPPQGKWGRPGFDELLLKIAGLWKSDRDKINADAQGLAEALKEHVRFEDGEGEAGEAAQKALYEHFKSNFNPTFGGFGEGGPKFPMPVNQNFLLRYHARAGDAHALEMVETTLRAMAKGGIYDQVGGGFARYSVDGWWRVPHFEKMLYDNAQLAVNYLEAYQAGKDEDFARIGRETLDYLLRDMRHPGGGFYSAEDADSLPAQLAAKGYPDEGHEHKAEGAFYLWMKEEFDEHLGENAELFAYRFGATEKGNALDDPHGEFTGRNILYADKTTRETAEKFGKSERETRRILKAGLEVLLRARAKRPRPSRDEKVLASWNGLALSAFARGYQVLEEKRYLDAAEDAARFLKKRLYDPKTKRLRHGWADGEAKVPGQADDYAFLANGLVDLYEASFDPDWLDWALDLAETLQKDFYDEGGGYYMTAERDSGHLLTRIIEDTDNVEPAASSVAALVLLRLSQSAQREDLKKAAEKTLRRFGGRLSERPHALPQMMVAADFASAKPRQIILAGELEDPGIREMLRIVHAGYAPARMLMLAPAGRTRERLAKRLGILKGMVPIGGKPTAYVCVNFACELPTNDIATFKKLLDKK